MLSHYLGALLLAYQAVSFPVTEKGGVKNIDGHEGFKIDFSVVHEVGVTNTRKRSISDKLINKKTYYTAELGFGSQDKTINVQIDTGSSDLWVIDSHAICGDRHAKYCLKYGTFNVDKSTTAKDLDLEFAILYGDETYAVGKYISDTVSLGNVTVQNVTIGLGKNVTATPGILGVGFRANEASYEVDNNYTYPTFVDHLVEQNIISGRYYSLYLDSPKSKSGSIIFGGTDDSYYEGKLVEVPLASNYEFFVNATKFSIDGSDFDAKLPVLLDSGTTDSYLPTKWVDQVAKEFAVIDFDEDTGMYVVDCKLVPEKNATFEFGDATINVPLSSFITKAYNAEGKKIKGCNINLGYSSSTPFDEDDPAILGDNFLRYAYVVYDLDNKKVSLAQAKFN